MEKNKFISIIIIGAIAILLNSVKIISKLFILINIQHIRCIYPYLVHMNPYCNTIILLLPITCKPKISIRVEVPNI